MTYYVCDVEPVQYADRWCRVIALRPEGAKKAAEEISDLDYNDYRDACDWSSGSREGLRAAEVYAAGWDEAFDQMKAEEILKFLRANRRELRRTGWVTIE